MNPLQQIEQETLEEGRELTRRMLEERVQFAIDEMGAIRALRTSWPSIF